MGTYVGGPYCRSVVRRLVHNLHFQTSILHAKHLQDMGSHPFIHSNLGVSVSPCAKPIGWTSSLFPRIQLLDGWVSCSPSQVVTGLCGQLEVIFCDYFWLSGPGASKNRKLVGISVVWPSPYNPSSLPFRVHRLEFKGCGCKTPGIRYLQEHSVPLLGIVALWPILFRDWLKQEGLHDILPWKGMLALSWVPG